LLTIWQRLADFVLYLHQVAACAKGLALALELERSGARALGRAGARARALGLALARSGAPALALERAGLALARSSARALERSGARARARALERSGDYIILIYVVARGPARWWHEDCLTISISL